MPIVVRRPQTKFEPAPEGLHQAVCVDVWEPWAQDNSFRPGETIDVTRIVWALEEPNPRTGKPFEASQLYRFSLHEKAKLCQHLQAWRGRAFTADEKKGFDLERLIGVNCQLQIVHKVREDGEVFANVQAIVPLGKGMTKIPVPEGYVRRKDRDGGPQDPAPDQATPDGEEVPF